MDLMQFISQDFIWIVPSLMALGAIFKNIPRERFPDWLIPIALLVIGVLLSSYFGNWSKESIMQGIICGLTATGTHQLVKQPIEKR